MSDAPYNPDDTSGDRRQDANKWLRDLIGGIVDKAEKRQLEREHVWRRRWRSVAVGYLILMIGGGYALYRIEKNDITRTRQAAVIARKADLAFCQRINRLRDQENRTAEAAWATLYVSAQRERKLSESGPGQQTHRRSADALTYIGHQFRHTPRTNCPLAVDHPDTYQAPRSVPFTPATSRVLQDLIRITGSPT